MRKPFLLLLLLISLILISCAGDDDLDKDKIPPFPPTMIPHLGDSGDPPTVYYGNPPRMITEDNNGIDAVPEGDWIRIAWKPFIDTDLSRVRIWRYDQFNPTPVIIDSINANVEQYLDSRNALEERVWYSYYIDLVDHSGNVARSDTVHYALLAKPILISPINGDTVSPLGATFRWNQSGFASKYRLVLFDMNYDYVWHQDLYVALEDELFITIPNNLASQYSGQSLRWRVDSFDYDQEMEAYMGAESQERIVHIQ